MDRKKLVFFLRTVLILCAVMAAGVCFLLLPLVFSHVTELYPEREKDRTLIFAAVWSFGIPLLLAMIPAWRVIGSLREKRGAFCRENALRLRRTGLFLALGTGLMLLFTLIMLFTGIMHRTPGYWFFPLFILLGGVAGFLCFALAYLVEESAEIREENDLTV